MEFLVNEMEFIVQISKKVMVVVEISKSYTSSQTIPYKEVKIFHVTDEPTEYSYLKI